MRNEPEPREGIVESRTPSPVKMRTAPPPPYELCGLPQDYIRTVVATYSYIAADEDELSFTKGEQILVVKHPQPEEQVFNLKFNQSRQGGQTSPPIFKIALKII